VALKHAILTMLVRQPLSGYDLVSHFQRSVGFLWQATHQQIYRELEKLRREALVSCKVVVQSSRPNKKVYSINARGRNELLAWVATPAPLQTEQRAGMLLRAYSYGRIDPAVVAARLMEYRKLHEERLTRLRASFDEAVSAPDEVLRTGALITLKAGVLHEEAYLHWCDWAADFIRRSSQGRGRAKRSPSPRRPRREPGRGG
jgi:DNA-binding PadR family transcriptional regulator